MKFQIGDKAKVIKNGNESFLKHFLEIGKEVEIMSLLKPTGAFKRWEGQEAYFVKGYNEPLLADELEKIIL